MNRIINTFLACLALAAGCIASTAAATATLTVPLKAENASGENGTATLTQTPDGVTVVVSIPNGPAGPQPAHIHDGTCATLGGVAYPLTSVASGNATSTIKGLTIDKLLAGKYAINVHKSTSDIGTYVSCGEIVKASAM
ncbi:MAG TPA: CHRD domain-containing protein [Candidatus Cybelea sp.]|jgi:Cu/Zn superoxide dismutase